MNTADNVTAHDRLVDHLEIGVLVVDGERRVQVWNRWLERHSEIHSEEAVGHLLTELCPEVAGSRLDTAISGALNSRLASLLSPALNKPVLPLSSRPYAAGEERLRQLVHVLPLPGEPPACLIQVQDMTAATRREDRLRHQSAELRDSSYRDALTQLGNRRKFTETIAMEFRRALRAHTSITLAIIDIDQFRAYQETYGDAGCNASLRATAAALTAGLRDSGDFVCRYGDDEFAVVLPGAGAEAACHVAERLRLGVANANPAGAGVTVSIGLGVMRPGPGDDLDALISATDMARHHAKSEGRNCVAVFNLENGTLDVLERTTTS